VKELDACQSVFSMSIFIKHTSRENMINSDSNNTKSVVVFRSVMTSHSFTLKTINRVYIETSYIVFFEILSVHTLFTAFLFYMYDRAGQK